MRGYSPTYLALRVMINALSIGAAVKLVRGIGFTGQWWRMIVVGATFGLVNSFIKPVLMLFSLPFIMLTLGVFTLIINALMLALTSAVSESLGLGFRIEDFGDAFWGAIIVSVVSIVLSCITGAGRLAHDTGGDPGG